jgi:hypothetical protein
MKEENIEQLRGLIVNFDDVRTQISKIATNKEVNLVRELIRLEDIKNPTPKEVDELTGIRATLLAPPFFITKRPVGPIQPLPRLTPEEQNKLVIEQAVAQASQPPADLGEALNIAKVLFLAGVPNDKLPLKFEVNENGYAEMIARDAAAAERKRLRDEEIRKIEERLNRPPFWQRVKLFFKGLFAKSEVEEPKPTVEVLAEEYLRLSPAELQDHLDAVLAATLRSKRA